MKARLFTQKNIGKLYLSPYVDYMMEGDKIVFRNDLFNQVVITPALKTDLAAFLGKLREGMAEEEMLNHLGQSFNAANPEALLTGLMQKGILE
jgi:hypothetical protein